MAQMNRWMKYVHKHRTDIVMLDKCILYFFPAYVKYNMLEIFNSGQIYKNEIAIF